MLKTDLKEVEAALAPFFSEAEKIEAVRATWKGRDVIKLTTCAMYDYPSYTGPNGLLGLVQSVTSACGGSGMEIVGKISQQGCETCDYGSLYGTEYVVWED